MKALIQSKGIHFTLIENIARLALEPQPKFTTSPAIPFEFQNIVYIFQRQTKPPMSVETKPIHIKSSQALHGGLHILSNFESLEINALREFYSFQDFIEATIGKLKLNKVGEAYHNFDGGGFTGVVCLSESHLSIHTWPDRNYVTFDIFLSNFSQDNGPKAKLIYQQVLDFFQAKVLFENTIKR
jgi:S-adenosylmethionine decarboxylase